MDHINRWQRHCLAVLASAVLIGVGGAAHAQDDRTASVPSVAYSGYDLTIVSLRAHPNCDDQTVGQFRRDPNQTIEQGLADDMRSSTLARITAWNWDHSARRIQLRGTGPSPYYRVTYFHGSENITKAVAAGTYRTPLLKRGSSFAIGLRVSMRHYVSNNHVKSFDVSALGVRFTNSVIHGDRVRTNVVSVPFDAITPCAP